MTARSTEEKAPSRSRSIETSRAQKALLVFFGLGLLALGLLVAEGVLTWLDLGEPQGPGAGFAPGNDLFEPVEIDGRAFYRTRPEKLAFFNEQRFPVEKSPDTLRVFALGGSTTAGRPYDHRVAFPRWLELFAAESADRPVEVVNAGGISYASYRIALLMEELIRYRPDVFLLYTGHNEFLEERTYSDILNEAPWQRRFRTMTRGLRSFTLARRALRFEEPGETAPNLAPEVQAKLDVWNGLDLFERDETLRESVLAHFEHNLRRMLSLASSEGIRVILVRPISNLKDFSPFKSQHDASLSSERVAEAERLLAEGKELLDRGSLEPRDLELAVRILEQAVVADPLYAESSFRLGRALLLAGRFEEAEVRLVRAKNEDVCPLRMLSAADRILTSVADETKTPLVDLPAWAREENRRLTGHGILGKELLLDHVHPTLEVHRQIALAVLELLGDLGEIELAQDRLQRLEPIVDDALEDLDEVYYARRDLNLSKVLGWAGKYEEALEPLERAVVHLYEDPEVFRNLGIVYQQIGRPGDALQAHQRAVELDASIPESHFNLGVVFGELGRWSRAVESLERAVELRPDYSEARFNLAVALRETGRLEEAERLLVALGEGGGRTPSIRRQRAMLAVQEARRHGEGNRPDEAEAAYLRALELSDEPARRVRIHNDLGVLQARQGRTDDAEQSFRRALDLDPAYAEARFNLALVLGNAGRLDASLRELQAALELEPENPRFLAALETLRQSMRSR